MRYGQLLSALLDQSHWFLPVPRALERSGKMRASDLLLFAHLIPLVNRAHEQGAGDGTWVPLPSAELEAASRRFTKSKVSEGLSRLSGLGLLRTKKKGRDRWLRFRAGGLRAVFPDLFRLGIVPKSGTVPISNIRGDNNPPKGGYIIPSPLNRKKGTPQKILSIRARGPEAHCKDCLSADWTGLGQELRDAIASVTKIPYTSGGPIHWGAQFRALHVRNQVPIRELTGVLSWYCGLLRREGDINTNGNPNLFPVCYSGEAFRKKFQQLEGAMSRDQVEQVGVQVRHEPSPQKPKRVRTKEEEKHSNREYHRTHDEWGFELSTEEIRAREKKHRGRGSEPRAAEGR